MGLRTAPNRIFCAAPVGLLGVIACAPESALCGWSWSTYRTSAWFVRHGGSFPAWPRG